MTLDEFVEVFKQDNRLLELMKMIGGIDRGNGYITTSELDDILKIVYPDVLAKKNLKQILKPFRCASNKVLVDYK